MKLVKSKNNLNNFFTLLIQYEIFYYILLFNFPCHIILIIVKIHGSDDIPNNLGNQDLHPSNHIEPLV